jgi:hypothetical protein
MSMHITLGNINISAAYQCTPHTKLIVSNLLYGSSLTLLKSVHEYLFLGLPVVPKERGDKGHNEDPEEGLGKIRYRTPSVESCGIWLTLTDLYTHHNNSLMMCGMAAAPSGSEWPSAARQ